MKHIQNNTPQPPHPLERIMIPSEVTKLLPDLKQNSTTTFLKFLEVYIDDFIGLIQASSLQDLQQFTRAVLHAIYNTFPPPELTGSRMGPPISQTKLQAEGVWQTRKEILGWIFDGIH